MVGTKEADSMQQREMSRQWQNIAAIATKGEETMRREAIEAAARGVAEAAEGAVHVVGAATGAGEATAAQQRQSKKHGSRGSNISKSK